MAMQQSMYDKSVVPLFHYFIPIHDFINRPLWPIHPSPPHVSVVGPVVSICISRVYIGRDVWSWKDSGVVYHYGLNRSSLLFTMFSTLNFLHLVHSFRFGFCGGGLDCLLLLNI